MTEERVISHHFPCYPTLMSCLWSSVADNGPDGFLLNRAGLQGLLVITAVSVFAVSSDPGAEEVEDEWNGAACQGDEGQERASPLIAEAMIHLHREEDDTGTPKGSNAGLGGES